MENECCFLANGIHKKQVMKPFDLPFGFMHKGFTHLGTSHLNRSSGAN